VRKPTEEGKGAPVLSGLHIQLFSCFVRVNSPPFEHVQQPSLLWGFPLNVYFALQKENHDLKVIKALNQPENSNRAD